MIWFLMLPLEIGFTLLALLLAPVLPMFARDEYGFCDNANAMRTEPRLPNWLAWFMTPDGSSYWHLYWVKQISATYCVNINLGWKLKTYAEDPERIKSQPVAMFTFSPRIAGFAVQP